MKISNETKIGALTAIAITLLILGYNFLRGNDIFSREQRFYATYSHVDGLTASKPVLVNGFQIGRVSTMKLLPSGKTVVEFKINKDYPIPENSVARLMSTDLLGSKAIEFELGNSAVYAEDQDTLRANVEKSLAEAVQPVQKKAENIISKMDSLLTSINNILNPNLQKNVDRSFKSIAATLESVESATQKVNGLVGSESGRIAKIMSNFESISTNLRNNNDHISHIVPNWVITVPDPSVTIGRICDPFKVEMVIRGYLAGHAWREYNAGKRSICGVSLPDGLKENDLLPEPIITPTTKAAVGHDEDISREDILLKGIVSEEDYIQLENYTRALFARGTEIAAQRDLILVDTKYEFGKADEKIFLIDEIHTPDSSRYFYKNGYNERQEKGQAQKQLSKEFVRQWLLDHNFSGQEGQQIPEMTPEIVRSISERYIELYEYITCTSFEKSEEIDTINRVEKNIQEALLLLP